MKFLDESGASLGKHQVLLESHVYYARVQGQLLDQPAVAQVGIEHHDFQER